MDASESADAAAVALMTTAVVVTPVSALPGAEAAMYIGVAVVGVAGVCPRASGGDGLRGAPRAWAECGCARTMGGGWVGGP